MNLNLQQFMVALKKGSPAVQKALVRAMQDAGRQAHKDAKANAPRSPTAGQSREQWYSKWSGRLAAGATSYKSFLAAKRAKKARRKAGSHSRHAPGGLERSIQWRLIGKGFSIDAEVYVAANAEAGKYAKRIHDEKGKTWRKRGPGTVAKGARADDKYILRAVQKAAKEFPARFQKWLARAR